MFHHGPISKVAPSSPINREHRGVTNLLDFEMGKKFKGETGAQVVSDGLIIDPQVVKYLRASSPDYSIQCIWE